MVSLGYDLNDYHSDYAGQSYTSRYLGLNGGANLGNWRLRHQSSLQQGDQDEAWSNIATYAQRSLPDWRSRLTLGQSWSSGSSSMPSAIRASTWAVTRACCPSRNGDLPPQSAA